MDVEMLKSAAWQFVTEVVGLIGVLAIIFISNVLSVWNNNRRWRNNIKYHLDKLAQEEIEKRDNEISELKNELGELKEKHAVARGFMERHKNISKEWEKQDDRR